MANFVYPLALTAFAKGQIDLLTGSTLKAMLVSTTTGAGSPQNYTYNSADEFITAVPAGARLTAGVALSGKAVAAGALTAASVLFPAVTQPAAQTGQKIVIYNDTGTPATSRLVALIDTLTNLPVTPNGADISITWTGAVVTLAQA